MNTLYRLNCQNCSFFNFLWSQQHFAICHNDSSPYQWESDKGNPVAVGKNIFFIYPLSRRRLIDLLVPGSFPDQFYLVRKEIIENKLVFF